MIDLCSKLTLLQKITNIKIEYHNDIEILIKIKYKLSVIAIIVLLSLLG